MKAFFYFVCIGITSASIAITRGAGASTTGDEAWGKTEVGLRRGGARPFQEQEGTTATTPRKRHTQQQSAASPDMVLPLQFSLWLEAFPKTDKDDSDAEEGISNKSDAISGTATMNNSTLFQDSRHFLNKGVLQAMTEFLCTTQADFKILRTVFTGQHQHEAQENQASTTSGTITSTTVQDGCFPYHLTSGASLSSSPSSPASSGGVNHMSYVFSEPDVRVQPRSNADYDLDWTVWILRYEVLQIGDLYVQEAMANDETIIAATAPTDNKNLNNRTTSNADSLLAEDADGEAANDAPLVSASLHAMRKVVQLSFDISMMEGKFDMMLQKHVTAAAKAASGAVDSSVNAAVHSSPFHREVETFTAIRAGNEHDDMDGSEVSEDSGTNKTADATFAEKRWYPMRFVGIMLFFLSLVSCLSFTELAKRRRRWIDVRITERQKQLQDEADAMIIEQQNKEHQQQQIVLPLNDNEQQKRQQYYSANLADVASRTQQSSLSDDANQTPPTRSASSFESGTGAASRSLSSATSTLSGRNSGDRGSSRATTPEPLQQCTGGGSASSFSPMSTYFGINFPSVLSPTMATTTKSPSRRGSVTGGASVSSSSFSSSSTATSGKKPSRSQPTTTASTMMTTSEEEPKTSHRGDVALFDENISAVGIDVSHSNDESFATCVEDSSNNNESSMAFRNSIRGDGPCDAAAACGSSSTSDHSLSEMMARTLGGIGIQLSPKQPIDPTPNSGRNTHSMDVDDGRDDDDGEHNNARKLIPMPDMLLKDANNKRIR